MMTIPDIIIAIDGYSSTGKSSFAKKIAKEFSFLYLDSGAIYRAVTLFAMESGFISEDGVVNEKALEGALEGLDVHFENIDGVNSTFIGRRCVETEIRTIEVSRFVSQVAALSPVRAYVDERLRSFGKDRRLVMDGRDIGTTVFPDAEIKIFMIADPRVRAQRRFDEMKAKGESPDFEEVLSNLSERDRIDSSREISPLVKADDAVVLDNSYMTFEEQMAWLKKLIEERFSA